VLEYVPIARMLSEETDNAEIIPRKGKSGILQVEIEVWGEPGTRKENTEIQESVPHIKLKLDSQCVPEEILLCVS
jgi:hypothetical protein